MYRSRAFHGLAIALATMLSGATSAGQERAVATDATGETVVGLLDIPGLVGGGCGLATPSSREVFDEPTDPAPRGAVTFIVHGRSRDGGTCDEGHLVLRASHTPQDLGVPTEESDYEVQALVVYERSEEWFRVALPRGSGWVRGTAQDFLPYPDLLVRRLAYIRKHWDGQLWSEPGGVARAVPAEWRAHVGDDINADVLAVRHHGHDSWIQVRLLTESCGETVPGVKSLTGWIRAYGPSGRPAAWFYARGC